MVVWKTPMCFSCHSEIHFDSMDFQKEPRHSFHVTGGNLRHFRENKTKDRALSTPQEPTGQSREIQICAHTSPTLPKAPLRTDHLKQDSSANI